MRDTSVCSRPEFVHSQFMNFDQELYRFLTTKSYREVSELTSNQKSESTTHHTIWLLDPLYRGRLSSDGESKENQSEELEEACEYIFKMALRRHRCRESSQD